MSIDWEELLGYDDDDIGDYYEDVIAEYEDEYDYE